MSIIFSEDNLIEFVDNYKDSKPLLNLEALASLLKSFILTLKKYINSQDKHFDWNKSIVQLEYNLENDASGNETIFNKKLLA